MHSYGVDDVLHRPLTEIVAIKRKLVLDLLVNAAGDADAVRLCQPLQARRNMNSSLRMSFFGKPVSTFPGHARSQRPPDTSKIVPVT